MTEVRVKISHAEHDAHLSVTIRRKSDCLSAEGVRSMKDVDYEQMNR